MPRQSFSRKRLDQKALIQKSIRFFGRFIFCLYKHRMFLFKRVFKPKNQKQYHAFDFLPEVLYNDGVNSPQTLGRASAPSGRELSPKVTEGARERRMFAQSERPIDNELIA